MQRARPNGRLPFPIPPRPRASRQARRSVPMRPPEETAPAPISIMRVVSHPDGWALTVDDVEQPAWVVSKKATAVQSARSAAAFHACVLQVRTRAGRLQRTYDFTEAG